jgi:hypothetical protein
MNADSKTRQIGGATGSAPRHCGAVLRLGDGATGITNKTNLTSTVQAEQTGTTDRSACSATRRTARYVRSGSALEQEVKRRWELPDLRPVEYVDLDGAVLTVGSVSLACFPPWHPGHGQHHQCSRLRRLQRHRRRRGRYRHDLERARKPWACGPIPMLGTDLRDDHPIGIEYCGGGLTGAARG